MDMKAKLTALTITVLMGGAVIPMAQAQYVGPSSQKTFTKVEQLVNNAKDDDPVALRGKLLRKLSDETYLLPMKPAKFRSRSMTRFSPKSRWMLTQPSRSLARWTRPSLAPMKWMSRQSLSFGKRVS